MQAGLLTNGHNGLCTAASPLCYENGGYITDADDDAVVHADDDGDGGTEDNDGSRTYTSAVSYRAFCLSLCLYLCQRPPRWSSGKASCSWAGDTGFGLLSTVSLALWLRHPPRERLIRVPFPLAPWGFLGIKLYQRLQNRHSGGYPARRLAL